MRRHVAIPIKTSILVATLMAGGMYVAAEARHAVVKQRQLELASLEKWSTNPNPSVPIPFRVPNHATTSVAGEPAGEKQAASLQSQTAAEVKDGHSREIVISIADRQLALLEDGALVKVYPIAVGSSQTPSPDGEFEIINHAKDPVYRHSGKQIAPGKENPLGSRWMGLSLKGYGIHGTNVPKSIGKAASHGCFRMRKQDVEDLYARVQVGDRVIIRRERDDMTARIFAPAPAFPVDQIQVASATTASGNGVAAAEAGQ